MSEWNKESMDNAWMDIAIDKINKLQKKLELIEAKNKVLMGLAEFMVKYELPLAKEAIKKCEEIERDE